MFKAHKAQEGGLININACCRRSGGRQERKRRRLSGAAETEGEKVGQRLTPSQRSRGEKKEIIVRAEKDSLLNDGGEEKKKGSRQKGGTGACHGSARRQWLSDAASIRVIPPRLTCLLGEKCDARKAFCERLFFATLMPIFFAILIGKRGQHRYAQRAPDDLLREGPSHYHLISISSGTHPVHY